MGILVQLVLSTLQIDVGDFIKLKWPFYRKCPAHWRMAHMVEKRFSQLCYLLDHSTTVALFLLKILKMELTTSWNTQTHTNTDALSRNQSWPRSEQPYERAQTECCDGEMGLLSEPVCKSDAVEEARLALKASEIKQKLYSTFFYTEYAGNTQRDRSERAKNRN